MNSEVNICRICGRIASYRCKCVEATYCGRLHQLKDWDDHKLTCTAKIKNSKQSSLLAVFYNGKAVQHGSQLSVEETAVCPSVQFEPKPPNLLFTLMMVDPDAPSARNPKFSDWLHWLVVNITNDADGDEVFSYQGPAPPPNTGRHRYYFYMHAQQRRINTEEININQRQSFNRSAFIRDHDLFPEAVAINMFLAAHAF